MLSIICMWAAVSGRGRGAGGAARMGGSRAGLPVDRGQARGGAPATAARLAPGAARRLLRAHAGRCRAARARPAWLGAARWLAPPAPAQLQACPRRGPFGRRPCAAHQALAAALGSRMIRELRARARVNNGQQAARWKACPSSVRCLARLHVPACAMGGRGVVALRRCSLSACRCTAASPCSRRGRFLLTGGRQGGGCEGSVIVVEDIGTGRWLTADS